MQGSGKQLDSSTKEANDSKEKHAFANGKNKKGRPKKSLNNITDSKVNGAQNGDVLGTKTKLHETGVAVSKTPRLKTRISYKLPAPVLHHHTYVHAHNNEGNSANGSLMNMQVVVPNAESSLTFGHQPPNISLSAGIRNPKEGECVRSTNNFTNAGRASSEGDICSMVPETCNESRPIDYIRNGDETSCHAFTQSGEAISALIFLPSGQGWLFFTMVYGSPCNTKREALWRHLDSVAKAHQYPCLITGDFNEYLFAHEKHSPRSSFKAGACVRHLARAKSDHCPLLLQLDPSFRSHPHLEPFRFEAMWLKHEGFQQFVADFWGQENGNLLNKTGELSKQLKICNSEVFGHLKLRKRRDLARITGVQKVLCEQQNPFLVNLEFELQKEYSQILDQEELLWMQKSRANNWHKDGTATLPNFFPVADQSFLDNLLVPVSNSETKNSMFTIGPYKAPGPDGFAACLYQQCWEICGAEVCDLVKQVFTTGEIPYDLTRTLIVLVPKAAASGTTSKPNY
ncbi:PREDICTED: reverse mRNAase [Prunus dulcis]|uniref:PREDICTED: reverse mRNAase n=1 Tax=Prunus dulcis TaxID=3755 RepID=A0A5E4F4D3_PRUDU|nr:PREDICTED: reverse mRNAase [Prunus dulcis]